MFARSFLLERAGLEPPKVGLFVYKVSNSEPNTPQMAQNGIFHTFQARFCLWSFKDFNFSYFLANFSFMANCWGEGGCKA